jgi:hypothetical protein
VYRRLSNNILVLVIAMEQADLLQYLPLNIWLAATTVKSVRDSYMQSGLPAHAGLLDEATRGP